MVQHKFYEQAFKFNICLNKLFDFQQAMVHHILMSALYSKPDIGILKEMKSMMKMLGLEEHFKVGGDLMIKKVSGNLNGVCEEKIEKSGEKSPCEVEENSEDCFKKEQQISTDNSKRPPLLENVTAEETKPSEANKNSTEPQKKSSDRSGLSSDQEAAKNDFVERGKELSVKLNKIREENTKLNLEYLQELDKKSALEEENLKRLEKHQNELVEEYKVLERRQRELEEELKKLSKRNQEAECKVNEARNSQEAQNGGRNKKQVGNKLL